MQSRVAVVTGAGRGIGRAIALNLGKAGARVLVNDAGVELDGTGGDPAIAESVAEEIRAAGGEAVANSTRVGPWSAGEEIVAAASDAFGQSPAIVVSSAVILRDRMSFNMSEEEWRDVVEVALDGPFALIRAALPAMRQAQWGRVVTLTSTAGLVGNIGQVNYAAAKGGLVAMTRVMALDTQRYGITANAVAPFAYTRMTERIKPNTPELEAYLDGARKALPEHVAPLVAYLCSDSSNGVTGQVFGVRGTEVMLFSQPRVVRSIADRRGWTNEGIAQAVDAWRAQGVLTSAETDLDLFRYPPLV